MRMNEFRNPPVSKTICSVSPLQDLYPSLHPRIVNVTLLLEGCNDSPRMTMRDLTSLTFIMCGEVPDSTLKYGDDILQRFTFDWTHSLFIMRNCRMNAPQWTTTLSHLLSPSVTLNNPPDLTHCLSSQEKLSTAFPPHERWSFRDKRQLYWSERNVQDTLLQINVCLTSSFTLSTLIIVLGLNICQYDTLVST